MKSFVLHVVPSAVSIPAPVASSYKPTVCFVPNAYMHMPWPLWERQMHIGPTCQTTSSSADWPPSKHKLFQRVWLSSVSVKRPCIQTRTHGHIFGQCLSRIIRAGWHFCHLTAPTMHPPPHTHTQTHTTRCNTETRMNRVGKMKKRREDRKRAEHKTGTGGRLSSPTIQI